MDEILIMELVLKYLTTDLCIFYPFTSSEKLYTYIIKILQDVIRYSRSFVIRPVYTIITIQVKNL